MKATNENYARFIWSVLPLLIAIAIWPFESASARSPYLNEPPDLKDSYNAYRTAKDALPDFERRHKEAVTAHGAAVETVRRYSIRYRTALDSAKYAVRKAEAVLKSLNAELGVLRQAISTPDPQIAELQEQLDALNSVSNSAVTAQAQELARRINALGREDFKRRSALREKEKQQVQKVERQETVLRQYTKAVSNLKGKTSDSGFPLSVENNLYFDLAQKSRAQRLAADALAEGLQDYWTKLSAYTKLYAKNAPIYLKDVEIRVDGEPHYRSNYVPKTKSVSIDSNLESKIEIAKVALPEIYEQLSKSAVAKEKATARIIELNKRIDSEWADFDTKNMLATGAPIVVDVVVTGAAIALTFGASEGADVAVNLAMIGLGKVGSELITKNVEGTKEFAGSGAAGQAVSGDSIEFVISNAEAIFQGLPNHFIPVLADTWDKLRGKTALPVRGIKPGTLSDIMSPQSIGLSVLGTVVKASVAQWLQNKADAAAQRYWSTIIELEVLTKLIYEERAFINFLEQVRQSYEKAVADYVQRKRLVEKDLTLKQVRTLDKPWADANKKSRKKQKIEIELGFSSPLANGPVVKLHGEVAEPVNRSSRGEAGKDWTAELVMKSQAPFELERFILDVSLWPDEKPLTKLDSNPVTGALPKPILQDWDRYEPGPDRNHGLLTRTPIPDLNARWVATSPVGFDRSAGSYLFKTVQTDKPPEIQTTDDRNAEPIIQEKHRLQMTIDFVPERVSFLCKKFPDPKQQCVAQGTLMLDAYLKETKDGPAYVGFAFPFQSNSTHPHYRTGLPVTVRFGEFGEFLLFELGRYDPNISTSRPVPTGQFIRFDRRGTANAEKTLQNYSQNANSNAAFYGFVYIIAERDVLTGEPLSEEYPAGIGQAGVVVRESEIGKEEPWKPPAITSEEKAWLANYLEEEKVRDTNEQMNAAQQNLLDKAGSIQGYNGIIPIPNFQPEPLSPLQSAPEPTPLLEPLQPVRPNPATPLNGNN